MHLDRGDRLNRATDASLESIMLKDEILHHVVPPQTIVVAATWGALGGAGFPQPHSSLLCRFLFSTDIC